jgi:hypothetical protein
VGRQTTITEHLHREAKPVGGGIGHPFILDGIRGPPLRAKMLDGSISELRANVRLSARLRLEHLLLAVG